MLGAEVIFYGSFPALIWLLPCYSRLPWVRKTCSQGSGSSSGRDGICVTLLFHLRWRERPTRGRVWIPAWKTSPSHWYCFWLLYGSFLPMIQCYGMHCYPPHLPVTEVWLYFAFLPGVSSKLVYRKWSIRSYWLIDEETEEQEPLCKYEWMLWALCWSLEM